MFDNMTGLEKRFNEAAELLRESGRLEAMHRASLALGVRDATERIYETVLSIMK